MQPDDQPTVALTSPPAAAKLDAQLREEQVTASRRAASSRRKGVAGEREVAAIFQAAGLTVRGLEGLGDHLVFSSRGFTLHNETKRQERLRLAWMVQAECETPQGTIPVVTFRPSRARWYSWLPTEDLATVLGS